MAILVASPASSFAAPEDWLKPPRDTAASRTLRRAAERHFKKAAVHFKAAEYDDALKELRIADDLDPRPDTLYGIAQVYRRMERCAEAITYLQRFLDTHPSPKPARTAADQIAVCKTKLPPEPAPEPTPPPPTPPPAPADPPPVAPAPPPVAPVVVVRPPDEPPAPTTRVTVIHHPWYKDKLGDTLVLTGLAAGGAAAFLYTRALSELDRADGASVLADHVRLRDSAYNQRKYAIVAGSAGAALFTLGLARYLFRDGDERRTVAVVPDRKGGTVSVGGKF